MPILLEMGHRAFGCVDRQMGEVGAAQTLDLSIKIGKIAALEQRVVTEIDARRYILGHEGDLFRFGKEIVDDPVQNQTPNDADRHQFFRNQLGCIQHVEVEAVGKRIVKQLNA